MFFARTTAGPADIAFTDRTGGVSTGPWSSLDLGMGGTGDHDAVTENLRRVGNELGVDQFVSLTQVHGADVAVIDETHDGRTPTGDALVTTCPGTTLLVRIADCLPVILADADAEVVAVAHAGRSGMALGVVPHTVEVMRSVGAQTIRAWLGPRICGSCYEVPASLADEVALLVPPARATTSWGTPSLDIGAGVRAQLESELVDVTDLGADACTMEHEEFFSFRRQGTNSGRLGAAVVMR